MFLHALEYAQILIKLLHLCSSYILYLSLVLQYFYSNQMPIILLVISCEQSLQAYAFLSMTMDS